jgi:hypothetical protein
LKHGEGNQVPLSGQRTVMHRTNSGISDRWILPVQLCRVRLHPRIIERRVEGKVRCCCYAAGGVRYNQWQSECSDLFTKTQQCLSLSAWLRIVEATEDTGIEAARRGRIGFEVAEDENTGSEAQESEQGYEGNRHSWGETLKTLTTHAESSGRRRDTAPAPPVPAPTRQQLDCFPAGR